MSSTAFVASPLGSFAYAKTWAADKTGIPFKHIYSYMIKTWKEIRNLKNLAIENYERKKSLGVLQLLCSSRHWSEHRNPSLKQSQYLFYETTRFLNWSKIGVADNFSIILNQTVVGYWRVINFDYSVIGHFQGRTQRLFRRLSFYCSLLLHMHPPMTYCSYHVSYYTVYWQPRRWRDF